jgi:hypothetical protein
MGKCKHCGEELSKSVYSSDKSLKSCPNCSQLNGDYHVFYKNPEAFGTTPLRSTSMHPEGIQSHCQECRGGNPPKSGILCCDIK